MRGISSKVEVLVGDPLSLYRLEILKELIRKAALRKLAAVRKAVKDPAYSLILSNHHLKGNALILKAKGEEVKIFAFFIGALYPNNYMK